MARLKWEEVEALPEGTELVCKYWGRLEPTFAGLIRHVEPLPELPILLRPDSNIRLEILDEIAYRDHELRAGIALRAIKSDVKNGRLILKFPKGYTP